MRQGPSPGIGGAGGRAGACTASLGTGYLQNGVEYPNPYDYSIYTDYLKVTINHQLISHPSSGSTELYPS